MRIFKKGFILLVLCMFVIACGEKSAHKQQEKTKVEKTARPVAKKKRRNYVTKKVVAKQERELTNKERRKLKRAARKFKREQRRKQRELEKNNK